MPEEPDPVTPARRPGRVRLGTQGWNYPAWVGPLYPAGTRAKDYLKLYARAFETVEIDSTFYAVPSANAVRGWLERTPRDFVFAPKLPREITHERELVGADSILREFLDRVRELGQRLGPVLVQLGPDFAPSKMSALEEFLPLLPDDIRFAVEFRHSGWLAEEVRDLLSEYRVALALSDGRWFPRDEILAQAMRPTTDFVYIRWMGENRDVMDYGRLQVDREAELLAWGEVIRGLSGRGFEAYGYVNNHFSGHSPATVRALQKRLGQEPLAPDEIGDQISLF